MLYYYWINSAPTQFSNTLHSMAYAHWLALLVIWSRTFCSPSQSFRVTPTCRRYIFLGLSSPFLLPPLEFPWMPCATAGMLWRSICGGCPLHRSWMTTIICSNILDGRLASVKDYYLLIYYSLTHFPLAAVSIYPPNDSCTNSNCIHRIPLKKEFRKKAIVYTDNTGVQPCWNTSIYCPSESLFQVIYLIDKTH